MHSNKIRLERLEKANRYANTAPRISQVVIYNPETGEPLAPIDPLAIKTIWIPDNGRGLDWNPR